MSSPGMLEREPLSGGAWQPPAIGSTVDRVGSDTLSVAGSYMDAVSGSGTPIKACVHTVGKGEVSRWAYRRVPNTRSCHRSVREHSQLQRMVEAGMLGKKSGRGFYTY